MWVNGENFRTLKEANLLQTGWAQTLPNWRYVDTANRSRKISPCQPRAQNLRGWRAAYLYRPQSEHADSTVRPAGITGRAQQHPGKISYPRPPDFTGTAFLEQLLLTLTSRPDALKRAPDDTFAQVTAPLWDYLDKLHPLLWREGKDFPPSPARMDTLLARGSLSLSLTFNPAHALQKWPAVNCLPTATALVFTTG